jgi:hypothetical protein
MSTLKSVTEANADRARAGRLSPAELLMNASDEARWRAATWEYLNGWDAAHRLMRAAAERLWREGKNPARAYPVVWTRIRCSSRDQADMMLRIRREWVADPKHPERARCYVVRRRRFTVTVGPRWN